MIYKQEEQRKLQEDLDRLKAMEEQRNQWEEMERENTEQAVLNKYEELVNYNNLDVLRESLQYTSLEELEDYIQELKNGYYVIGIYNALEIYKDNYYEIKEILEKYSEEVGEIESEILLDIEKVINLSFEIVGHILENLLDTAKEETENYEE